MNEEMAISDLFKSYMYVENTYKGGRSAPHGVKSYKLSSNENALGTSPKVKDVLNGIVDYHIYPDNTDEALRLALHKHHKGRISAEQFICGNSGSEVIEMAIRAFINLGDEVILSSPCFLPYHTFSQRAGAKVIDIPLIGKAYDLDVQSILEAITTKTRIIFLTSPNNPTGTHIPQKHIKTLLSQIPKNVLIIFDEVYYQYADAEDFSTAIPFVEEGYNILAINSFSKAFGMAGLRLGYGYTTSEIAKYLRLFQRPFLINKLSLQAGIAALSDEQFIQKTIQNNFEQKQLLGNAFQKLDLDYIPSQGNFHLVQPPMPSEQFVDLLFDRGVMVRDVSNFGAPGRVRITIGTPEGNKALICALEEIL